MSTEKTEATKGNARVRQGVVVKNKMQKTVVVEVTRRVPHSKYVKFVKRRIRYKAHDEIKCQVGDVVLLEETRPMSKEKRWRVKEVVIRATNV
jgi:small subunit ribosomal protein S17